MKKFILTTLTATALMGTTVFANITDFADYNTDFGYGKISGHWGENELTVLHDNGGLNGTTQADGTLRLNPNKEVTAAEFLAMIFQATGTEIKQHDGLSWVENMYQNAVDMGLMEVHSELSYSTTDYSWSVNISEVPFNRYAAAAILNDMDTKLSGDAGISILTSGSPAYNSSRAESKGLIADGTFNGYRGDDTLTRVEACALANRLVYNTPRLLSDETRPNYESYALVYGSEDSEIEIITSMDNRWMSRESSMGVKSSELYPQEGDLIDGRVITKDPWTGILGFGEGQTGWLWNNCNMSGVSVTLTEFDHLRSTSSLIISQTGFCYTNREWELIKDKAYLYYLESTGTYPENEWLDPNVDPLYMDIYGNSLPSEDGATFWNPTAGSGTYSWDIIK